jgi:hypothetical protein
MSVIVPGAGLFQVSGFGFAELAGVYPARRGLGSEFQID